jgi:hypothetical protein
MGDPAVPVENDGKGEGRKPVTQGLGEIHRVVAPDKRWVVKVEFLCELDDFIPLIDGDADELQAPRAELALRSNEFGHLLATRAAPGRPEIDDEHLSAPLAQ